MEKLKLQAHHIRQIAELHEKGENPEVWAERHVGRLGEIAPEYRLGIPMFRTQMTRAFAIAAEAMASDNVVEIQDGTADVICVNCNRRECHIESLIKRDRQTTSYHEWGTKGIMPFS